MKNVTTNWSGVISLADFDTSNPNKKRMSSHTKADNLYKELKEKQEKEKKFQEYLNMSLEQLREQRLISNSNGKPTDLMTDEKWQLEFELRKRFIKKHDIHIKRFGRLYTRMTGTWNEENGKFQGDTNYKYYCSYMNDVLKNIKCGKVDYCYFIYQITDLYRFDFGTRELKTKYCDGYWEVWLG